MFTATHTFAQKTDYPNRPIRLIIPFAPGGGIDTIGRIMAQKLNASFGQSVVVDNRAGSGGKIGIETALGAAPDGYTMLSRVGTAPTPPSTSCRTIRSPMSPGSR
ncbi:MAG: hypothetical protein K8S22_08940 [Betaproteobacteria bacterium]|nr:hypothetical protein [Betaproteobacteria bacterium]